MLKIERNWGKIANYLPIAQQTSALLQEKTETKPTIVRTHARTVATFLKWALLEK